MRWFARPETAPLKLRVDPRLASWDKAETLAQKRLREYLDDTEELLTGSRVEGPWALRLDVGLADTRDLLDAADLDNFAYPLAERLQNSGLVSVWCTKQHSEQSSVRIDVARELPSPSTGVLIAKTTASATTVAYKEQIRAAVEHATALPEGPVRLELAFVVGPARQWLNLWKPTIDSLDPFLGRTHPDRAWHPRDGRITELGMHVTVDPTARNEVIVGILASPEYMPVSPDGRRGSNEQLTISQPRTHDRRLEADPVSDAQITVREVARANGWQVVVANNHEDLYVLSAEPDKTIRVSWAASGDVLFAYGDRASFIARFDGLPPTKNERVLSALRSKTDVIPPHRPNDSAAELDSRPDSAADNRPDESENYARESGVRQFRDDEAAYLAWLAANPDGYVINIARSHTATTGRLHAADCRTISGTNPEGGRWVGQYVKICAERLTDLEDWASRVVGKPVARCGTCRPV